ncbi:MAG: hypothetical protein EZS28_000746 [Streblomastix strix]|uniref:Reverse transcriptase RNase H-like domain-containing protein n=1 Tax=Streblomastix strix TaxID=222440 RepID=A0A5J4X963_9EUKA|nr:MAG: hypothetical protein EZS28_000746 [Streblomastix strix]
MEKNEASDGDGEFCGDQCDLNLSSVQSGRQIIELLAAMEIVRPERQNAKRYNAYLERPKLCAQSRSPNTQDDFQKRLRSTLELIQDYLIRAGKRRYNQGPVLFHKVLESNFRGPKKERRLEEDLGLSNFEQQVENRLFQLQRNAVWSFNGLENIYKMPPTSNSRCQEAMLLTDIHPDRRFSDPELGSHNTTTRNVTNIEDSIRVWLDNRNGQVPDQSDENSRGLELAVEHQNNDNANDNFPKERSVEVTKTSERTSQENETRKNRVLGIGNWRDPTHKKQFKRGELHIKLLQKLKDNEVASRVSHNQPLCYTKPNKRITIQTDSSSSGQGATQTRENQEKVFAHGEWKDNYLKSSNQREVTAVLKALPEFRQELIQQQPIGILLLIDNTVTMYYLNKDKGTITIAQLVDKVLKLAEQYNGTIQANHIYGLYNTISDSITKVCRCGDYAIKKEVLQKILKELRIQISMDIFAICANQQCTKYSCITKDKFAVKRKGFKLQWSKEIPLLHSPIS